MIEIRDAVIWTKHIHGDNAVRIQLSELDAGKLAVLKIDGTELTFAKMNDGSDGRPTSGLKPVGETARTAWNELYEDRRGDLVPFEVVTIG